MQTEQQGFNPKKLNETSPTMVRFPERFSLEPQNIDSEVKLSELERTVGGYYELESEYDEIKKAIRADIGITLESLEEKEIRNLVSPIIDSINKDRVEQGVEVLDIDKLDISYLKRLAATHILEDATKSKEGLNNNTFFRVHNPEIMPLLEDMHEVHSKLAVLSQDSELMQSVREARAEQYTLRRVVAGYVAAEKRANLISDNISSIYRVVNRSGRQMTKSEQRRIARLEKKRDEALRARTDALIAHPEVIDLIQEELQARMILKDKHQLEKGLLVTDQVGVKLNELMVAVSSGNPVLLVGETGGAKTAIAEYMCQHIMGKTAEFVSGFGDVNAYQLMGKMGLSSENGATVSNFMPGPIVRAMEEGRPLILDEINAMPAEILKRLNKIMQLRPGDKFVVQEDSGREVTVKQGFCIIATANEKSKRYKGVDDLSTEFANRFGANIVRVHYPDTDVAIGQLPPDLMRLATALMIGQTGKELTGVTPSQLESFVKAAHITQQLFTANYGGENSGKADIFVSTESIVDQTPGLEETVIAPRTMIDILVKVKDANGRLSFKQILETYVDGIKNLEDRKVIARILQSNGLIGD